MRISSPAPPSSVFVPLVTIKASLPARPKSVSSPVPPSMVLSALFPIKVSEASDAIIFSKSFKTSVSLLLFIIPVFLVKSTVTASDPL